MSNLHEVTVVLSGALSVLTRFDFELAEMVKEFDLSEPYLKTDDLSDLRGAVRVLNRRVLELSREYSAHADARDASALGAPEDALTGPRVIEPRSPAGPSPQEVATRE